MFDIIGKILRSREKYSEDKLKRDIELSESGNYNVEAAVNKKGDLCFVVPDISTIPPGLMKVDGGVAVVDGFGTAKIKFSNPFSETPALVKAVFGFFELKVPWVTLQWRQFNIGWWSINIPVPKLNFMTIRLPTMCFLMNVEKDGFEVFNVLGRSYITYLAVGR